VPPGIAVACAAEVFVAFAGPWRYTGVSFPAPERESTANWRGSTMALVAVACGDRAPIIILNHEGHSIMGRAGDVLLPWPHALRRGEKECDR